MIEQVWDGLLQPMEVVIQETVNSSLYVGHDPAIYIDKLMKMLLLVT